MLDVIAVAAEAATAIGLIIAVVTLEWSRRQSRTQFEDQLTTEFRSLLGTLPIDAVLGRDIDEQAMTTALSVFYRYFDLTNDQVFMRAQRRVSAKTWANWDDGIRGMIALPAFEKAWARIISTRRHFDGLSTLRELSPGDLPPEVGPRITRVRAGVVG